MFTRFVRTQPIPDELAETVARVFFDDRISVFGPMEWLLSDGELTWLDKSYKI